LKKGKGWRDEEVANADGRGSALGGYADLKHLPCRWTQMGRWGDGENKLVLLDMFNSLAHWLKT